MTAASVATIVEALNRSGSRYLIAGGLAVVAHGLVRFTADVDLVLDPAPGAADAAIAALEDLGYRPRAPVPFHDFADPEKRRAWIRDKGLTVFSVHSDRHPATEIDLFVDSPLDFDRASANAWKGEVAPGVVATFVSRADLIAMKRRAGRPVDLSDIAGLESGTGGASGER